MPGTNPHTKIPRIDPNTPGATANPADPCRLSIITSVGCGDSEEQMQKLSWFFAYIIRPFFLTGVYEDLEKAEKVLFDHESKKTKTKTTISRPGGLGNVPGTGMFRLAEGTDLEGVTSGLIPRADVAAAMVSLIEDRRWDGKPVSIINPQHAAEKQAEEKSAAMQFWEKWKGGWTRLFSAKEQGGGN